MNRVQKMRERGREDYRKGKPIEAYYETQLSLQLPAHKKSGRRTEAMRACYEMGWIEERERQRKQERNG